jgi:hypothetical protein
MRKTNSGWGSGGASLTSDQIAAINNANAPTGLNPFATIVDVVAELTVDELAAINNANAPTGLNPFATLDDIVDFPILTVDELAAINNANAPTGLNPFATIADIPADELTADELAAIQGAAAPSGINPFATITDLPSPYTLSHLIATAPTAAGIASDTTHLYQWNTINDQIGTDIVVRVANNGIIDINSDGIYAVSCSSLLIASSPANATKALAIVVALCPVLPNMSAQGEGIPVLASGRYEYGGSFTAYLESGTTISVSGVMTASVGTWSHSSRNISVQRIA